MRRTMILIILLGHVASATAKPIPPSITKPAKADVDTAALERLQRTQEIMACIDEQNRFQAEVQRRTNTCDVKAMEFRQCVARVRDRQSSNTGKGALIGLGAAVLTGGASLLFTGAGALIGHQASDEAPNECGPAPDCRSAVIIEATTRETGLRRIDCQLLLKK